MNILQFLVHFRHKFDMKIMFSSTIEATESDLKNFCLA